MRLKEQYIGGIEAVDRKRYLLRAGNIDEGIQRLASPTRINAYLKAIGPIS